MTVPLAAVLALGLAVALGAAVQSAVGFGLAVVAAPFGPGAPPWCNGSTPAFGAVQSRFES